MVEERCGSYFRNSFNIVRKNPKIFVPDIISTIVTFLALFIFALVNNMIPFSNFSVEGVKSHSSSVLTSMFSTLPGAVQLIISFLIVFILAVFIKMGLSSMRYSIIKEATFGIKLKYREHLRRSHHFIYSLFWLRTLILLIILIIISLAGLAMLTDSATLSLLIIFIWFIIAAVVFVSISFSVPSLYYDRTRNPFKVVSKSIKFVKKNLGLVLLMILILLIFKAVFLLFALLMNNLIMAAKILLSCNIIPIILVIIYLLVSLFYSLWKTAFIFEAYRGESNLK